MAVKSLREALYHCFAEDRRKAPTPFCTPYCLYSEPGFRKIYGVSLHQELDTRIGNISLRASTIAAEIIIYSWKNRGSKGKHPPLPSGLAGKEPVCLSQGGQERHK